MRIRETSGDDFGGDVLVQSTQRPKDYNIWTNRGHPCFDKNEMALLVTFCIQIPI